jgi:hypothetical protein
MADSIIAGSAMGFTHLPSPSTRGHCPKL